MPYITYSRSHDSGRLFEACKRLGRRLGREGAATAVVRRGRKTISDVVVDSVGRGFDSIIILDFRDSSGKEIVARRIAVHGAAGDYSWADAGALA